MYICETKKKMEEIVKELEVSQVKLSNIQDNDFVGIDWGESKVKVVLRDGVYFGIGIKDTNFSSKWCSDTTRGYVEDCLKQQGTKAYRFDSKQDLLEWLLKK